MSLGLRDIGNHVIPFFTGPEIATYHGMSMYLDNRFPACLVLEGNLPTGERTIIISHEVRRRVPPVGDQSRLEHLQLQRFRDDCRVANGSDPIWTVQRGDDPPDFVVTPTGGGAGLGLECTAFSDRTQTRTFALFDDLRRTLLTQGRRRYSHLRNHAVYVQYGGEVPELPHCRSNTAAQQSLCDAIAAIGRPECFPPKVAASLLQVDLDADAVRTPFNAMTWATPLESEVSSEFADSELGFLLVLSFTTRHLSSSAQEHLLERIAAKDVPENDWLLISAGAPTKFASPIVGEEHEADLLLDHSLGLTTSHLKRVFLHRWGQRDAWELFPTQRCLTGERRDSPADNTDAA